MKSTLLFCFCFVFISFGVLGKVGKNCPAGIPLCRCRRKGVVICKKTDCLQRLPTGNITLEEGRQITSIVVSRQRSFEIIRSRDLTVLPNLKSARFFDNGIYAVLRGAFSYTPNIERLDLHKNRLSAIPHEIKSLRHLRQLNLGGNEISSIRFDAFSGNPRLQKLILKRNKLETFPGSLPPSLVKISIGGNLIPSFGDLRYLSNLKILRAEFNRLTTIGSSSLPPSLAELSICSNALSSDGLDVSNLTRLKRLRLGGNVGIGPITRETFFKGANRLRELEIGHSNIDVIEPDSFACMRHLVVVDIGGNSLHTVDQELFAHNDNLRRVMVSGNPLQCDCLLVSTLESLNQRLLGRFPREIDGSPRSSAVDLDHVVCADVDMRLTFPQNPPTTTAASLSRDASSKSSCTTLLPVPDT
uniref:LRRCT domain-containing protein n=1 Tax=Ciona savignyi TaxID=51511 RepID=H2Y505_CIOSA